MLANASGPLRLWVLGRGLGRRYPDWLAAAFPSLPITYLPCDQISYGADGRPRRSPKRITISTMDRLLLPLMLDDVDRVVYLDVDTVMLDDVCRSPGPTSAAGRSPRATQRQRGQRMATRRTPAPGADGHRPAPTLRAPIRLRGAALNAGVLVMDLARMRRDGFTDDARLGRALRAQRPGQDARLRRARSGPCSIRAGTRCPSSRTSTTRASSTGPASASPGSRPDVRAGRAGAVRGAGAAARRPPADGEATAPAARRPGPLANPVQVGAVTTPVAAGRERVIDEVLGEHLSYLDRPRCGRSRRRSSRSRPRGSGADRRDRHGARRLRDHDGLRQVAGPADEGVRRVRDDPAARRAGRRGRPQALRDDRRRRVQGNRRRDLLRLPERPAGRGHRLVRAPRLPLADNRSSSSRACSRTRSTCTSPSRWRTSTATGTRPR